MAVGAVEAAERDAAQAREVPRILADLDAAVRAELRLLVAVTEFAEEPAGGRGTGRPDRLGPVLDALESAERAQALARAGVPDLLDEVVRRALAMC